MPDNEAGCFDIYNKQGERIGAFDYSDIKVRQDSQTGKQFLISEHGTMSYDAMVLDGELKDALQNVMGVETLETEELSGFTLKTHSGTGIQYLVRDGEEGRGEKSFCRARQTGKGMRPLRRPTSINIPIWYMIKTPHTYGLIWRLRDWHSTRIMGLFVWALMGCPIMTIQIIRTIGAFCFREIPIRRFLTGCRTTGEVLKKCRNLLHGRMCLRALAVTMSGYGLMKKKTGVSE